MIRDDAAFVARFGVLRRWEFWFAVASLAAEIIHLGTTPPHTQARWAFFGITVVADLIILRFAVRETAREAAISGALGRLVKSETSGEQP